MYFYTDFKRPPFAAESGCKDSQITLQVEVAMQIYFFFKYNNVFALTKVVKNCGVIQKIELFN